jgi:hypothetical protein
MARHTIKGALLGQLLAFIIALTAVCSASLAQQVRPPKSCVGPSSPILFTVAFVGSHAAHRQSCWRCRSGAACWRR